jgi:TRAP-type C4-dicarboxylate transport system permease small subunit
MIQKLMQRLQSISRVALVLGTVFMLCMGATTALNVILRIFNIAMTGFMESIELMMIGTVLGAMAFAIFEKTQVAIDVLVEHLSPSIRKKLEVVALVANLVFWAAIGWATLDWLLRGAFSAVTQVLAIPMWPFQLLWLLGLLYFFLVYLTELLLLKSERRTTE